MKTGIYFRLKRNGKFQPTDILEATKEELTEIMKGREDFAVNLVITLCDIIKDGKYKDAKALLELAFKDDDLMNQETLFELQEKLAHFTLRIAQQERETDDLIESFPYLYGRKKS